jgi:DNA-binding response OmpR family regulator
MSNRTILVVEDDPDISLGYRVFLNAHHYKTFFATDAASAVSESLRLNPDLIILDLGLPGPGGGLGALEAFQGNPALCAVPVIVVSGRDPSGSEAQSLKAGAKCFIQKPWNNDHLLATIAQLLPPNQVDS